LALEGKSAALAKMTANVNAFIQDTPMTMFTNDGSHLPTLSEFKKTHFENGHLGLNVKNGYHCDCTSEVTEYGKVSTSLIMKLMENGGRRWTVIIDYSNIGDDNFAVGYTRSVIDNLGTPDSITEPSELVLVYWYDIDDTYRYNVVFRLDIDKIMCFISEE